MSDMVVRTPKLEGMYFTIHNQDVEMFEYLWHQIVQYITSSVVLDLTIKMYEAQWEEGIVFILRDEGTQNLLKNLSDKSLEYFLNEVT